MPVLCNTCLSTLTSRSTMASLTKLYLLLILITHSLATTPYRAHNATNADDARKTVCRDTEVWIGPSWLSLPLGPQEAYARCQILISELYYLQPEITTSHPPLHEYLPPGIRPAYPGLLPVRTPWRFTRGTYNNISPKGGLFPAFSLCCCCYFRYH